VDDQANDVKIDAVEHFGRERPRRFHGADFGESMGGKFSLSVKQGTINRPDREKSRKPHCIGFEAVSDPLHRNKIEACISTPLSSEKVFYEFAERSASIWPEQW
jgi:hypothetical protein